MAGSVPVPPEMLKPYASTGWPLIIDIDDDGPDPNNGQRAHRNVVIVALANKLARIAWASART